MNNSNKSNQLIEKFVALTFIIILVILVFNIILPIFSGNNYSKKVSKDQQTRKVVPKEKEDKNNVNDDNEINSDKIIQCLNEQYPMAVNRIYYITNKSVFKPKKNLQKLQDVTFRNYKNFVSDCVGATFNSLYKNYGNDIADLVNKKTKKLYLEIEQYIYNSDSTTQKNYDNDEYDEGENYADEGDN